jgi:hypothetical protein
VADENPEEGPMTKAVHVQVLYFDGCPHWQLMDERVQAVAAERGLDVEHVLVESDDDAQRLAFHGSPTLLVDGRDPFASPGAAVGLACRIYTTPDGLAGAPTEHQIREVLP